MTTYLGLDTEQSHAKLLKASHLLILAQILHDKVDENQ